MNSIEEIVEDSIKSQLNTLKIPYYAKTQGINTEIDEALTKAPSKSGGDGKNYPDIKLLIKTKTLRTIPIMIEAKGLKNKLAKFKDEEIENTTKDNKPYYKNIQEYALNGAVHYANAILDYTHSYDEVIAIGVNGYYESSSDKEPKIEYALYYLNRENLSIPKKNRRF